MKGIAETIGERIRIYRNRAGLTQEKLAEMAGVHHTYVGQLERGEKNASLETIEKIATALRLPFEVLFEAIVFGDMKNTAAKEIYELITAQPEREQKVLIDLIKKTVDYKKI